MMKRGKLRETINIKSQLITWSVVFSYWIYTLDLVQCMLDDSGMPCTRIEGKTSLSKRTEALR